MLPFPKANENLNPLEEGSIVFENNGLKMEEKSINELSAP